MHSAVVSFGLMAAFFALWATIAAVRMGVELQRRSLKVDWLWFRVLMPKYVHQYKQLTEKESGRPGPLFYHFVVPINVALAFAVMGVIAALR